MCFSKSILGSAALFFAVALAIFPSLQAADKPVLNQSGFGMFVSFQGGLLTLKGKSGHLVYDNVGENYKTFQNNEEGPGSRLVGTVMALSGEKLQGKITPLTRVLPGTKMRVDVEKREIYFGYDFRVIGSFVSYQDGKLNLLAADVPAGFVKIPTGNLALPVGAATPVLESIEGDYLKFTGAAGDVLKNAKPGAVITTHSHYDPDVIEVVEIGEPKHRMERYIGQTRGTVRGTFLSFATMPKGDILRIHGRGIGPNAADEYDQLVVRRVDANIPILESIDGGPYQKTTVDALKSAKEGTIITMRKVEDLILDIRIGVPK